jgi:putative ABC transport system ATP-binding protein
MSVSIRSARVCFERWGEQICPFDHLDLDIEPGEWVMLAGPNGSGKTTLLRVIAGSQPLEKGTVTVWGLDPARLAPAQRAKLVFSVTQNPLTGTAADLTAFENLFLAEDCPRASRRELRHRYSGLLEPIGLHNALDQSLTSLSGGQRQLLALALASLRPARLILLDEPLAALDPERTKLALETIRILWKSNKTILQVAHNPDLLMEEGMRTVILAGGKFVYDERDTKRDRNALLQAVQRFPV